MKYETNLSTDWFCWIRSLAVKKTAHIITTNLCSHVQKMQSILLSRHIHSLQDTLNILIIGMMLNLKFMWKRNVNWPELKTKSRPMDLSEFLKIQTSILLILISLRITKSFSFILKMILLKLTTTFYMPSWSLNFKTSSLCNWRSCQ